MTNKRTGGFTLIELLTVIAIIAILAAMLSVAIPRALEASKKASLKNTCNQIRTVCVDYFTRNSDSFPPAYGYVEKGSKEDPNGPRWHYKPYLVYFDFFKEKGVYDRFGFSYDTDRDGEISRLEYSPLGISSGPGQLEFSRNIYDGGPGFSGEVAKMMNEQRPLVYIPVNTKQAQKVFKYYTQIAQSSPRDGWYATRWNPSESIPGGNPIAGMTFPPVKYDDYILISVGPGGTTGGILAAPQGFLANVDPADYYHVLALRAYFLATRDANNNDLWDFDFRNRSTGDEADPGNYPSEGLNFLPDNTNLGGPIIYSPNGDRITE